MGKKLPEKQILRLFKLGATVNLKGFKDQGIKKEGTVSFNKSNDLVFLEKKVVAKKTPTSSESPICPKCGKGNIVKGKSAYGCSNWKAGCKLRYSFADIKKKAAGKPLTKEAVLKILAEFG